LQDPPFHKKGEGLDKAKNLGMIKREMRKVTMWISGEGESNSLSYMDLEILRVWITLGITEG